LLRREVGGRWKCDGSRVRRLIKVARLRLPTDAAQMADVLHGLGEMEARSDGGFLEPMINLVKRCRPHPDLARVLNAAARRDGEHKHPPTFESLAFGQWIAQARLDWGSFEQAIRSQEHPRHLAAWRYGLAFTARLALTLSPHAVDRWLRAHPGHPAIAVVGTAAQELQLPWNRVPGAVSLLASRTPALRCIAAAALVEPVGPGKALPLEDCAQVLESGGFAAGDVAWMLGWRLKRVVHARYWVGHQIEQIVARRRYVEAHPEAAVGGRRNATAEVQGLEKQVAQAKQRQAELADSLETTIRDLAAIWPAQGLTQEQRRQLSPIFVETPEIRYRLAMELPPGADRDFLLQANIAQLRAFLGLGDGLSEALASHFHRDEGQFEQIDTWTAQSMVALYVRDKVGVGRRTGLLLQPMSDAADAMIAQPFAAGRHPVSWSSTMGRAAFAYRFALSVVAVVPMEQKASVAILNGMALDHAFVLLSGARWEGEHDRLFDRLAAQAVGCLALQENSDTARLRWAQSEALPDFARALALWSSPTLVESHQALADALFHCVAELPLSRGAYNAQASRLLSLLDNALAIAAKNGDLGRRDRLISLWDAVYAPWRPLCDDWTEAARLMAAAVAADGPERRTLLADAAYRATACRHLIESAAAAG
jgi:hypothetical protein